ncbi:hypothetical protein J4213_02620 [Candidatus Woesearchaeota archaeon]|nr:hypothetical protein [Candidatus Woesearchaeota archaeon]
MGKFEDSYDKKRVMKQITNFNKDLISLIIKYNQIPFNLFANDLKNPIWGLIDGIDGDLKALRTKVVELIRKFENI